jgi:serine/threonine protein kinase
MFQNTDIANLAGEISLNRRTLAVQRKIGEGGFAYVYLVSTSNMSNGGGGMNFDEQGRSGPQELFCLKATTIQSEEAKGVAEMEVNILRQCVDHPNIVTMVDSVLRPSGRGKMDHLILMEYMQGGHMFDVVGKMAKQGKLWDPYQLVRSFGQICLGVMHLHNNGITHRDLKLENFLLSSTGIYKLCDFGSCINGDVVLDSQLARTKAEEVIGKTTTQMYRAPEMVDLYMSKLLTNKTDTWALGCCLYTMAYFKNTFEEGSNLAIISAKYTIPSPNPYSGVIGDGLVKLIEFMLTTDANARLDITEVLQSLQNMSDNKPVSANQPACLPACPLSLSSFRNPSQLTPSTLSFYKDSPSCASSAGLPKRRGRQRQFRIVSHGRPGRAKENRG